jgi:hypothetical protein
MGEGPAALSRAFFYPYFHYSGLSEIVGQVLERKLKKISCCLPKGAVSLFLLET